LLATQELCTHSTDRRHFQCITFGPSITSSKRPLGTDHAAARRHFECSRRSKFGATGGILAEPMLQVIPEPPLNRLESQAAPRKSMGFCRNAVGRQT
jgi:hypothetical protein